MIVPSLRGTRASTPVNSVLGPDLWQEIEQCGNALPASEFDSVQHFGSSHLLNEEARHRLSTLAAANGRVDFAVTLEAAQRPGPLQPNFAALAVKWAFSRREKFVANLTAARIRDISGRTAYALRALALAEPGSRDEFEANLAAAKIPGMPGGNDCALRAINLAEHDSHDEFEATLAAARIPGIQNQAAYAVRAVQLAEHGTRDEFEANLTAAKIPGIQGQAAYAARAVKSAEPGSRDKFKACLQAAKIPGMPGLTEYAALAVQLAEHGTRDDFDANLTAARIPGNPDGVECAARAVALAEPDSREEFLATLTAAKIPRMPGRAELLARAMQLASDDHDNFDVYLTGAKIHGPFQGDYAALALTFAHSRREEFEANLQAGKIPQMPAHAKALAQQRAIELANPIPSWMVKLPSFWLNG